MRRVLSKRLKAKAYDLTKGEPYSGYYWQPQRSNRLVKDKDGKEAPYRPHSVALIPNCTRKLYKKLKREFRRG